MGKGRFAFFGIVATLVCAAAALAAGSPRAFKVVFPEGFTRARMTDQVSAVRRIALRELRTSHQPARIALTGTAYARATSHVVVPCFGKGTQRSAEGFLFPSTYSFDQRTLGSNVVANQVGAFCNQWSKLDLSYARSKHLTAYDVLTIASMVEAEAALSGDRPKIAAVIYNRLRLNMP
ncbi:MAG TPA: endolytic transglycosylase MltG, partial [Gaiellaceae bacterium]